MHPSDAPTGAHKEYPRMPRIMLPQPRRLETPLYDAIGNRRSLRRNGIAQGLSDEVLGTLLGTALGVSTNAPLRHYPSAGALFPIETYLVGYVRKDAAPGVFHYHPTTHALEHLWDMPADFKPLDMNTSSARIEGAFRIFFTAVWERSSAKYGDFAYSHALLEAGHMAQNILLVAEALSLSARPLAGFDDAFIADVLDIRAPYEQAVYSVTISPSETITL